MRLHLHDKQSMCDNSNNYYCIVVKFKCTSFISVFSEALEPDLDLTEALLALDVTEDLLGLLRIPAGALLLLLSTTGTCEISS